MGGGANPRFDGCRGLLSCLSACSTAKPQKYYNWKDQEDDGLEYLSSLRIREPSSYHFNDFFCFHGVSSLSPLSPPTGLLLNTIILGKIGKTCLPSILGVSAEGVKEHEDQRAGGSGKIVDFRLRILKKE